MTTQAPAQQSLPQTPAPAPQQLAPQAATAAPAASATPAAPQYQGLTAQEVRAYEQEYLTSGKLSEESYQRFALAGYERSEVDKYVNDQKQKAKQLIDNIKAAAGGEQVYEAARQWSSQLSEAERALLSAEIESQDPARMEAAAKYLTFRYQQSQPKPAQHPAAPSLIPQAAPFAVPKPTYRSTEEMKADIRNPKYQTDPAFRQDVEEKLAAFNGLSVTRHGYASTN